jgi:hypothetical protein
MKTPCRSCEKGGLFRDLLADIFYVVRNPVTNHHGFPLTLTACLRQLVEPPAGIFPALCIKRTKRVWVMIKVILIIHLFFVIHAFPAEARVGILTNLGLESEVMLEAVSERVRVNNVTDCGWRSGEEFGRIVYWDTQTHGNRSGRHNSRSRRHSHSFALSQNFVDLNRLKNTLGVLYVPPFPTVLNKAEELLDNGGDVYNRNNLQREAIYSRKFRPAFAHRFMMFAFYSSIRRYGDPRSVPRSELLGGNCGGLAGGIDRINGRLDLSITNQQRFTRHILCGDQGSPDKKDTEQRDYGQPDSYDEHPERPRSHILLGLQIIFGLLYAAISAYIIGETSKPLKEAAFVHDGPAGICATLGGIGLIQGCGLAFIGVFLLVG